MEKSAKIKIIGRNTDSGEEVSFYTIGKVQLDSLSVKVEYEEKKETSVDSTTILISDDVVSVTKIGELSHTMIFEEGKTNQATLSTEYGDMNANILTKSVQNQMTDGQIDLKMIYAIEIGGTVLSNNEFTITIKYN